MGLLDSSLELNLQDCFVFLKHSADCSDVRFNEYFNQVNIYCDGAFVCVSASGKITVYSVLSQADVSALLTLLWVRVFKNFLTQKVAH